MPDAQTLADTAAVVVAGGKGLRAGGTMPKQFVAWRGMPLIRHSVAALLAAGARPVVVVVPGDGQDAARGALEDLDVRLVVGGDTRQASVRQGLEALAQGGAEAMAGFVMIHDAARPVIPTIVLARLAAALGDGDAAIPVLPVADSVITEQDGRMHAALERDGIRRVQTPQAFRTGAILAAHRTWQGAPVAGDDAQVAVAAGLTVALVEGDEALRKMTYADDFAAHPQTTRPAMRIGTGFDVHRLAEGEELWLCGVRIAHDRGLSGHSDADVAIHALVDAMLGALGAGDIGQHFPPSDPQWRGAASDRFLQHALSLAQREGYAVGNVDVTIICEAPKIGPHRGAMRARLAELLCVDAAQVSVKATTTERLGFTGRGEGIAAQAVASLMQT